ncbi:hypothetical protein BASA81_016864 [Batrachochytrium salamandrivorans]|nr:hypothetical protein BASA81_016864 [Batrachochytrium salamandrivorans]
MLSAVVDAQYGGYDLDPQYMQQVQQPSRLNFQQALQYSQPSFQPWQQSGGPTFQDYQQQSSYTQVVSPSDQCGKIADDNGVIPFKEWGKLTESMKTTWGQQGCDQEMCQYWAKKYHIAPLKVAAQCQKAYLQPGIMSRCSVTFELVLTLQPSAKLHQLNFEPIQSGSGAACLNMPGCFGPKETAM